MGILRSLKNKNIFLQKVIYDDKSFINNTLFFIAALMIQFGIAGFFKNDKFFPKIKVLKNRKKQDY